MSVPVPNPFEVPQDPSSSDGDHDFDFDQWVNEYDAQLDNQAMFPVSFDANMPIDPQIQDGTAAAPAFDHDMDLMLPGGDTAGNMSPFDFTMSTDVIPGTMGTTASGGMNAGGNSIDPQMLAAGVPLGTHVHQEDHKIPMGYPSQGASLMAPNMALQGQYPPQRVQEPLFSAPGAGQFLQPPQQTYEKSYNFSWDRQRSRQVTPELPTASGQMGFKVSKPVSSTNATPQDSLEGFTQIHGGRPLLPKLPVGLDGNTPSGSSSLLSSPELVVPVKKQTVKAKKSSSKDRKSTSKAKQEAVKFPIVTNQLLISNLGDANRAAIKRIPLQVKDDDRDEVAANPELWIRRIPKAFEHNYTEECEGDARLTKEGRDEFLRWQKEHDNKVWAIFTEHQEDIFKFLQACAYIFYDLVLEAHFPGNGLNPVSKCISNGGANVTLKCSERLKAAIQALKDYSIVKYDFLKQERLDGLAASPRGFVHRKVENMFVNYKKKKGTGPVRIEEEAVTASKAKGKKRKFSSPVSSPESSPALSDGDSEDDADDDQEEEAEVDYEAMDADSDPEQDQDSSSEEEEDDDDDYEDTIRVARPTKRLRSSRK